MHRRGFLGSLIACVAAPFLPTSRVIEYRMNTTGLTDAERAAAINRTTFKFLRGYSVTIPRDGETMRPNGSYFRCQ